MQRRGRRGSVVDRWRTNGQRSAEAGRGMRWCARCVDDSRRERSKSFNRRNDAQRWLDAEVTARIAVGTYIAPDRAKVTFAAFYRDWSPRQLWESNTRRSMNIAVASVQFGDVALGELRAAHIEAWIKTMSNKGLAATTIRARLTSIRTVIRAAVAHGYCGRDVTAGVKVPRLRKAAAAMSIPAPHEIGALIEAAPDWMSLFVALGAFSGLRHGEIAALRVSDFDFLRRELHVTRQVQFSADGSGVEVRPPKYGSERVVAVPDRLLEMTAEYIRCHRPGEDPDRWLFPGLRDPSLPVHRVTVGRCWRELRQHVGVDYRIHDLRHHCASALISAGCDVTTVAAALGPQLTGADVEGLRALVAQQR